MHFPDTIHKSIPNSAPINIRDFNGLPFSDSIWLIACGFLSGFYSAGRFLRFSDSFWPQVTVFSGIFYPTGEDLRFPDSFWPQVMVFCSIFYPISPEFCISDNPQSNIGSRHENTIRIGIFCKYRIVFVGDIQIFEEILSEKTKLSIFG